MREIKFRFWNKKEEIKLVDQFIRATLKIGKNHGLKDTYTFENLEKVVSDLFARQKQEPDVAFKVEPGAEFEPSFKNDKFSIQRVKFDKEEADTGEWVAKEKEELKKLNDSKQI